MRDDMSISNEGDMLLNPKTDDKHDSGRTATVFQTSVNITKLCMGTGTLALPYASQVGGLVFMLWDCYSLDFGLTTPLIAY